MLTHELQSLRLCISDVLHYKMARDEAQHGTFSEPTHTGIHTTTQRGTVPSCIDMVHRRKTHSMVGGGGETQQELILFKHNEMVGCRPGIVGVDGDREWCMALEGMALESRQQRRTHEAPVKLLRIR